MKIEQKEMEGTITKVSPDGYGFILSPELPFTRIFFHWTALRQDTLNFTQLKKYMRVRFVPVNTHNQGYRAFKIMVLDNGRTDNGRREAEGQIQDTNGNVGRSEAGKESNGE